jgi:hypothetical protein
MLSAITTHHDHVGFSKFGDGREAKHNGKAMTQRRQKRKLKELSSNQTKLADDTVEGGDGWCEDRVAIAIGRLQRMRVAACWVT